MSTHTNKLAPPASSIEQFETSSIIRFGALNNYIQEKLFTDTFVIQGNLGLARGLKFYLKNQQTRLQSLPQIKILDVGPGIGALTTLLALQELGRIDLLQKTKVILLDISERVIERTQKRDFTFPSMIIEETFRPLIKTKLRLSKGINAHAKKIPLKDQTIDISLAGFLFGHLHKNSKEAAAQEIQRVTKPSGFIGITDAHHKNQEDYLALHRDDEIPLAYQDSISYARLRRLFPKVEIFDARNGLKNRRPEPYYYFSGMKRAS